MVMWVYCHLPLKNSAAAPYSPSLLPFLSNGLGSSAVLAATATAIAMAIPLPNGKVSLLRCNFYPKNTAAHLTHPLFYLPFSFPNLAGYGGCREFGSHCHGIISLLTWAIPCPKYHKARWVSLSAILFQKNSLLHLTHHPFSLPIQARYGDWHRLAVTVAGE